uniref:Ig-like domain-containing protein n=1 Tax=Sphingosinicella terrae TaxID=2172047 RepID=UPI00254663B5
MSDRHDYSRLLDQRISSGRSPEWSSSAVESGLGISIAPLGQWRLVGSEFQIGDVNAEGAATDVIQLPGGGFLSTWQYHDGVQLQAFARRYDASGAPLGASISIPPGIITSLADGRFLRVFGADDADDLGVFAQIYDENLAEVVAEFQVNTVTGGDQTAYMATGLSGGGFVVTWASPDGDRSGIFARVYNQEDEAIGDQFRLNVGTTYSQNFPTIEALSGGGFVAVWVNILPSSSGGGELVARIYDSNGVPVTGELAVNSYSPGTQWQQTITALSGGGFVVVWEGEGTSGRGIYGQMFDDDGARIGGEFRIDPVDGAYSQNPDVEALANGGFVVCWDTQGQPATDNIFARTFDAQGNVVGPIFEMNGPEAGGGNSTAALDDGGFVVIWSVDHGSTESVWGQRFGPGASAVEQVTYDLAQAITIQGQGDSGGVLTLVLDVGYGRLFVAPGSSGAEVAGSGTGTVAATGSLSQLQALLEGRDGATVEYMADGDDPPSSVDLTGLVYPAGEDPSSGATASVGIHIVAVNDAPSLAFTGGTVDEHSEVGTIVGVASASDSDAPVSDLVFSLDTSWGGMFAIDAASGVITVVDSAGLDFERGVTREITIRVTDPGGAFATSIQTITVNNVDPEPPRAPSRDLWINEIFQIGQVQYVEIAGLAAIDPSGWTISIYGAGGYSSSPAGWAGEFFPDQMNGFGTLTLSLSNFFSDTVPRAFALVRPDGSVAEFISYGGTVAALAGPAVGLTSTDVGVMPYPQSFAIGRVGSGDEVSDFGWARVNSSLGRPNDCQTFEYYPGEAPTAVDDEVTAEQDTEIRISAADLLANDTDPDSSSLFITSVGAIVNGTAELDSEGNIVFQPAPGFTGEAAFDYVVSDGTSSDTAHVVVHVGPAVNEAPILTVDFPPGLMVNEENSLSLKGLVSVADSDSGSSSLTMTFSVDYGRVHIDPGSSGAIVTDSDTSDVTVSGTLAQLNDLLNTALDSLVLVIPDSDFPPPESTLTVTVNDNGNTGSGGPLSDSASSTILIASYNDAPVLDGIQGDNVTFVEGGQPARLDAGSDAIASDPEGESAGWYGGGSINISITGNKVAGEDELLLIDTESLTVVDDLVYVDTVYVGWIVDWASGGPGAGDLQISFESSFITQDAISAIIGSVAYRNSSDSAPSTDDREITFSLRDGGDGGLNPAKTVSSVMTVSVLGVNDAPVHGIPAIQLMPEDETLIFSAERGNAIFVTDPDGLQSDVTVTVSVGDGSLTLAGSDGVDVSGEGSTTLTLTGTVFDVNQALDGLGFAPVENFAGEVILSVTTTDGGDVPLSDSDTITITVEPVNDRPTLVLSGASVLEHASIGTLVGTAHATDLESSVFEFSLDNADGLFEIGAATGEIRVANSAGLDFESGAAREITIRVSDPDGGVTTLVRTITLTDIDEEVAGGSGNDGLSALSNDDWVLSGGGGADILAGRGGNDRLDGGSGADDMRGAGGNDTYIVDHAGDRVTELSGQGVDTVRSSVSHTLANHIENLAL